ncbi:AraC family transcriptional regulator [Shewanella sp. Isolate11]|uniref:AraC family transcriptional regulator n=1 Tax=Shewanella sp. Isolate11 TaxID=2908530 RepID=UPI001EFE8AC7|nr:AraC family transcriptional regulator [Shewanella sp. Isolate11]MCG9695459.1 AraC family transcriptional regulator [Shewanella sp. Isolate11]
MNTQANQDYSKRIEAVCDYIAKHLEQPLSVEQLSEVAHFSKYHFHRQFQVFTGINVGKYITMLRLKRASYRLVFHPQLKITDIAYDAGFENSESFSRAFKAQFQQTPSQFRLTPKWEAWNAHYAKVKITRRDNVNIDITQRETVKVAVLEHQGSPASLNQSIQQFIAWRKQTTESPVASSQTFGVPLNDPNTVAPEEFRFDICGSVTQDVAANDFGIITKAIPGGRCAVIRHHGPHDQMDDKIYHFYREWLPQSGEELRDFPLYFEYINFFPEVAEHELITDIYFSLK